MSAEDLVALTEVGRLVGYPGWTRPGYDGMGARGVYFLRSGNGSRLYWPASWLDGGPMIDLLALTAWSDEDGFGWFERWRIVTQFHTSAQVRATAAAAALARMVAR